MELSKATIEDVSPVRKRIAIEVPAQSVQAEIDRAFSSVGQRASLRGFRPGKAPRPVLERVFGDQIRREVFGRLVEESLQQAVDEHRLAVVGTPDIEAESVEPGAAFRYTATVDVRPVIEVGEIGGLEAQRPAAIVTDADVEGVVNSLRESVAQLRPIEDRAVVEAGDVVGVDLTSRLDGGEPVQREGVLRGGRRRQLPARARAAARGTAPRSSPVAAGPVSGGLSEPGSGGQDRGVRGRDQGPPRQGTASPGRRVRPRPRTQRVAGGVPHAYSRRPRAAGDAAGRGPGAGGGRGPAARSDTRSTYRRHWSTAAATRILGSLDVRLPDGADGEKALARLREQVRPRAERDVRADLLLDAVAAREGIVVTDEDVQHEIDAMSAREGQVPERVRAFYERPEARTALRARLVRERTLARVMERARIVPTDGSEEVARLK